MHKATLKEITLAHHCAQSHLAVSLMLFVCITGAEGMSFLFVWLRLSTMKQLDWYRNSSYQSKDIAHVQKTTTQRIADKVRSQVAVIRWERYQTRHPRCQQHALLYI